MFTEGRVPESDVIGEFRDAEEAIAWTEEGDAVAVTCEHDAVVWILDG